MTKTMTLLLSVSLLPACAGGDDDGDDGMNADSGSVGGSDESTGDTTAGMTGDPTTAPTTAETLSTTATTDDESSSGGADSSTGDAPAELSCASYCDVYLAGCVDFSEYANEQDCLDNCAQWPMGAAPDTAVDSLGCRLYHATVATSTDPSIHCPHAGPSGAATCVTENAPDCGLYCSRYFESCVDGLNAYDDEADCMAQCGGWYAGSAKDVDGDTIGCRTYHAGAALADPDTHCPHAGPGGGGVCVL